MMQNQFTLNVNLLLCALLLAAISANQLVDLGGSGCSKLGDYIIGDQDEVITVQAVPRYNSLPTTSRCDVTIRAEENRRIQYIISLLKFNDCGIEVRIFDSLQRVDPKHIFKCGSETKVPIRSMTRYNVMYIQVIQPTADSRFYEFQMRLKNDLGPPLEYLEDEEGYQGESLQPGVIVGLAIAGVLIIIALVLLAIYLCVRARQANLKENSGSIQGESSIYTSGTSQAILPFREQPLSKRKGYGSFEDVRTTTSSQDQANGSYANPAYTKGSDEKRSERQASFGRARGKAGFSNDAFDGEGGYREDYWEEGEATRGSLRKSRRDAYDFDTPPKKELKSAMKKPTEIEMSKVNTQPVSILKQKTRSRSPNRSYAGSSTDGSTVDTNAIIRGYKDSGIDHPNVKKSLGIQRRPRSRSGGRSHHSSSSAGRGSQRGHRSHSADKKTPKDTGRMYTGAFIDDGSHKRNGRRARSSSSAGRSRARSDRTSDSLDSESTSTTTSRRVSLNPGGRRVHIKGEETDI
ncbi:hypothetical protein PoB_004830600 [Plakobranchus ocellatus]|uniref:CUB domain-containing protein n=1 Tax=Plakobranchus ocellatus TaxID=259542 RepID=A0AAV4BMX0_9GAST|nr:hypothetical protein PoB_004830600 [Plakobranchus ocellatus]